MLKKIKDRIRILFDPTMFKYHQKYMEFISAEPCNYYYKKPFNNDFIIVFNEKCQSCMNMHISECVHKSDNLNFDAMLSGLCKRICDAKNLNSNYRTIIAFHINKNKYSSYEDFYHNFLLKCKKVFVADFIILYGLKKHDVKIIKCIDNINIGVTHTPIYANKYECIIKES